MILQQRDLVGQARRLLVQRGQQQRRAAGAQVRERGDNLGAPGRIEAAERLIQEQDAGAHRPERGQRQSLLLAAGERPWRTMARLRQSEARQGLRHPRADLAGRQAHRLQAPGDFIFDLGVERLGGGVLEEQPDGARRRSGRCDIVPGDAHAAREIAAGVAWRQPGEQVAERTLTAARRAHHRDDRIAVDAQRGVAEERASWLIPCYRASAADRQKSRDPNRFWS